MVHETKYVTVQQGAIYAPSVYGPGAATQGFIQQFTNIGQGVQRTQREGSKILVRGIKVVLAMENASVQRALYVRWALVGVKASPAAAYASAGHATGAWPANFWETPTHTATNSTGDVSDIYNRINPRVFQRVFKQGRLLLNPTTTQNAATTLISRETHVMFKRYFRMNMILTFDDSAGAPVAGNPLDRGYDIYFLFWVAGGAGDTAASGGTVAVRGFLRIYWKDL